MSAPAGKCNGSVKRLLLYTDTPYSRFQRESANCMSSCTALTRVCTGWRRYYPPFLGAIKAEVGSIMCSYNRINGNYSCGNNETLATDYKARAGFEGWVMRYALNYLDGN